LPITLSVAQSVADDLRVGEEIALIENNGATNGSAKILGVMKIAEKFLMIKRAKRRKFIAPPKPRIPASPAS